MDDTGAGGVSRRTLLRSVGTATLAAATAGAVGDELARARAQDEFRVRTAATNLSTRPTATSVRWRASTTERLLALTFDDGPSTEYTPPLLDVLAAEGVAATFCVIGRHAQAAPAILRRQVAQGHELVNHSWSHPDLSALPHPRVQQELRRTDELIAATTGVRPRLMRPPWGRVSGSVLAAASELEYDVLLWDTQVIERNTTVQQDVQHVLGTLLPGSTLLAHDYGPARRHIGMASVQPVIQGAKARGYRFVTASELFAPPA